MRWIPFAILLYLATTFQTTVAPFLSVHNVRPDLLVIIAAHYALAARTHDTLLACWFIGLAADLTSLGYDRHSGVGLHALAMGLAALCIVGVRDLLLRDSVITQLVITFLVALLQSIVVGAYFWYMVANRPHLSDILLSGVYGAIYAALFAPYGHWLLRRLRTLLGLGAATRIRVG